MSTTHAGATRPGAPDPTSSPRRRYVLAAATAVVGLTASSLWAGSGVLEQTRRPVELDRADVPGAVTLTVDEASRLVVHVEVVRTARSDGGGAAPTVTVDGLTVAGPTGESVRLEDYPDDLRYDVPTTALPDDGPARVGTAVAWFDADEPGTYTVTATGAVHLEGADGVGEAQAATLAVGGDLAPGTARAILLPTLTGAASVLLAAGLALGTASRQARGSRS